MHAGKNQNKPVCLQESGGSLLQGPLAHVGLLGTGIIEGTTADGGEEAPPRGARVPKMFPVCPQLMCELGNAVINHIYEGSDREGGPKKPLPSSSR